MEEKWKSLSEQAVAYKHLAWCGVYHPQTSPDLSTRESNLVKNTFQRLCGHTKRVSRDLQIRPRFS